MDELRFRIDAFRPDTIPMARLAEYMAELAAFLGHEKSVHFLRLDPGSVQVVHRVDVEDIPKVEARLAAFRAGDSPPDAMRAAFRRLDDMLANDNAMGELVAGPAEEIVRFPGRSRPKPVAYAPFSQPGSLDGVPIRVGGTRELVSVQLLERGPEALDRVCQASRSLAREIARYLFETTIRVHGKGQWRRLGDGAWKLEQFTIGEFEVLDDAPLEDVVARLRAVEENGWRTVDRPLEALRDLRDGEESRH